MNERATTRNAELPRPWRRRLRTSRLVQYLLLQALIVRGCVCALPHRCRSRRPHISSRRLGSPSAAPTPVKLPYFLPGASDTLRHASRGRSTGRPARPGRAWSVFLPRFTNAVEVAVNDVVILDSRRDPAANRPDRNTPEIAVIPASLLHDGANDLSIRLFIWGPITGFLDAV